MKTAKYSVCLRILLLALAAVCEAHAAGLKYWVEPCTDSAETGCKTGDAELAQWATGDEVRGEITVVVGGAVTGSVEVDPEVLAAEVAALVADGVERKAAIRQVATRHGLPKREVYHATL